MNKGIYKITNTINGKVYIGQSTNLKDRIKQHKSMIKNFNENNNYLRKATKKYGYKNFKIEIIKFCDEKELDYYEIYYIDLYKSSDRNFGYNIELGGNINKHLSKEQIYKMKKNKKGKLKGKDNPFFGKKHTEKTKKIISEKQKGNKYCLGRILSDETKSKIGLANRYNRTKKINQYDLNNNFIKSYFSVGEAKRKLNVKSESLIAQCARGDRKSAYGYKWKYADEELQKIN